MAASNAPAANTAQDHARTDPLFDFDIGPVPWQDEDNDFL
jgi:hypothetical protein